MEVMFPFEESNEQVPTFETDDQFKKGTLLIIVILWIKTFRHGETTRFIIGLFMITVVILSIVQFQRWPRWTMNKALFRGHMKNPILPHTMKIIT